MKFTSFSLICALLFCGAAFGQADVARVSGRVSDPNAAVILGATVTAKNADTGVAAVAPTNDQGLYNFENLPPGKYVFSVTKQGFKTISRPDVVLHVGDTVSMNFSLQLGAVSETVTVQGGSPLINTQDGSVGTVVEREFVENMPLNGRSFQSLITLSPGINTVTLNSNTQGQFVVNGQRADTNFFSVDGVSAMAAPSSAGNTLSSGGAGAGATTAATGGYQTLVSVDALQEFKITTSSFAPEFGNTPGGQIALVTRGGTNAYHGDLFDYLRNTDLDANDWFRNATSGARPVVIQNDFGGVFGGPIIKDKLFFFASYEGLRLQNPVPLSSPVPTSSARALAAAAVNNGVTGYMAQFLNAYALPTGNPATLCTNTTTCIANDVGSFPGKTSLDAFSIRGDYNLSSKSNVFFRFSNTPSDLITTSTVDTNATTFTDKVYTAGWSYLLSSQISNDLRFNYTYNTRVASAIPLNYKGSLSTFFPAGFAQPPAAFYNLGLMSLQISGFTGGVTGFSLTQNSTNQSDGSLNIADTVSYIRGAHQIRFGVDFRQLDADVVQPAFNNNNAFALVAGNLNTCTVGAVSGLPPYICGNASLANLQHIGPTDFRFNQFSAFFQDTWKFNQRLTLTYGLRWEVMPSPHTLNNAATFAVTQASFNLASLKNVVVAPLGSALYATSWGNISPRVGLAYQLINDPKWGTVVRAGAGLFYDTGAQAATQSQGPYAVRVNNTTAPNIPVNACGGCVAYPITVAQQVYFTPPPFAQTAPFNDGSDILVDPNFVLPRVFQMNLSVEQQLGARQSVTVSYVGALGRNLQGTVAYPSTLGNPAQLGSGAGGTADTVTVFGNFASSSYNALQTKFQKQVSHGLGILASYTWAHSIDNASQNTGLSSYLPTSAAQLLTGLPSTLFRANSDFDIRNSFAFSVVYDAPTPYANSMLSRAILGHWSIDPIYHFQSALPQDLTTAVTNNFPAVAIPNVSQLALTQRPELVPGIPIYVTGAACVAENLAQSPAINGCPGGRAINNAAANTTNGATTAQILAVGCQAPTATNAKGPFCTPATQPLTVNGVATNQAVSGNVPRNFLRAYHLQEFDFSIHRSFPIHESIRLQFEADMFNVFNHPQFGGISNGLSSGTFGLPQSMASTALLSTGAGTGFNSLYQEGGPRSYQFALKLFF